VKTVCMHMDTKFSIEENNRFLYLILILRNTNMCDTFSCILALPRFDAQSLETSVGWVQGWNLKCLFDSQRSP
jgi:hypothetical protein